MGRDVSKRLVLGITGIRSEYYLQRPIFRAIAEHPDLELKLVVTGAHLSPLHGYSASEVEADGFPIAAHLESLLYSDRDAGRIKSAALQLQILAHLVDSLRPDWLLAPADREEAMTMALCGGYLNVATAHYGAGDRVIGNVDDTMRHAVSRLSHLLLLDHELGTRLLVQHHQLLDLIVGIALGLLGATACCQPTETSQCDHELLHDDSPPLLET